MLFKKESFNPKKILWEICILQCIFYAVLTVSLAALVGPYMDTYSPKYIIDTSLVNFTDFTGYMVASSYGIASILLSIGIWKVVKRMKKCADFTFTVYFIHTVVCWIGQPGWFPLQNMAWWICIGTSFALTALVSEWLCSREELAEIELSELVPAALQTAMLPTTSGSGVDGVMKKIPVLVE